MSVTVYDLECDLCERGFAIEDVFSIDYHDNTSQVACADCVETFDLEKIANVWQ